MRSGVKTAPASARASTASRRNATSASSSSGGPIVFDRELDQIRIARLAVPLAHGGLDHLANDRARDTLVGVDLELRMQAGGERMLCEQAAAEGVDRAHDPAVERAEQRAGALPAQRLGARERAGVDAVAQPAIGDLREHLSQAARPSPRPPPP